MYYFPSFGYNDPEESTEFISETMRLCEEIKDMVKGVTYVTSNMDSLLKMARKHYTEEQLKAIKSLPVLIKYINSMFVSCHDYITVSTVVNGKLLFCNLKHMAGD
jgi:DNA-directed RNA polymerase subunit F